MARAGISGSGQSAAALKTADTILSRQIDNVLATTHVVAASNVVIMSVVIATLWTSADPVLLGLWAALVAVTLLALEIANRLYRAEGPKDLPRHRFWARAIEAISGLRALCWGLVMILFFPGADHGTQLVLGPTAAAIMFGGATVLSSMPSTAMLFITVLGGSLFVALLNDGTSAATALAIMTIAYIAYLLAAIVNHARFFISHALAEIDNDEQKQTIDLLLKEFEDNSSDWLWHTDANGCFVAPSKRFVAASGRPARILDGMGFSELFIAAPDGAGTRAVERFAHGKPLNGEDVALEVAGKRRIWSLTAGPRFDAEGAFVGYRGVASDVTDLRAATEKLRQLAHYDQLTGLLNRASFVAELNRAIEGEGAASVGIVLFDLTGFKLVNDTLGHGVGDKLLTGLGARMKALNRPNRRFARLGGDEFALLVDGFPEPADLEAAAGEALADFATPFAIGPHNVAIDASAGIALGGRDGSDAAALMRAADLALYAAKSSGRGRWRAYDEDMATAYLRRQNLERGLREAIAKNELSLRYQPIVSARTGQITAFEALLRWHSAEFGSVPPDEFVPIAEECGLIVPIGEWVMHQAGTTCMDFPEDIQICINVSPVQLRNRDFAVNTARCLKDCGLAPGRLVVEITEGVFLDRSAQTDKMLSDLMVLGVQISLDDFGTGYSSLSYLRSFPFSKIKIDKSFVDDAVAGGPNASIVKASVDLARSFGFEIVVEGVESHSQLAELVRLGCDYVQGFLFGQPLRRGELAGFIAENAADRAVRTADVA